MGQIFSGEFSLEIQWTAEYCHFKAFALICVKETGKKRRVENATAALTPTHPVGSDNAKASLLVELLKRGCVFKSLSVAVHASAISL